jgi:hypothetical protein
VQEAPKSGVGGAIVLLALRWKLTANRNALEPQEQHQYAFVHHNAKFDLQLAQLSVMLILLALSLYAAAQLLVLLLLCSYLFCGVGRTPTLCRLADTPASQ